MLAHQGFDGLRRFAEQIAGAAWLAIAVGVCTLGLGILPAVFLRERMATLAAAEPKTPAAATPAGVPPVASAAAPSTPKPEAPKQEAPKQEAPKPAGLAMQAGAFSRHADADRRRGEILLLGYDARIETVKSADGQTRYRVSVGPFADPEALARARRALHDVGIDTL